MNDKHIVHDDLAVTIQRLRLYLRAEKAILSGQSYSMEGVSLTRADLGKVQAMISELESRRRKLEVQTGIRTRRSRLKYVIPRDGVSSW